MKQIIFTLLLITSIGLISCRKTKNDPDIKQNDQLQIQNYINANGLTGMKTVAGDTSGIYYQILSQGSTTTPIAYSDSIAFVFTLKSFDGKYISVDTVNVNHVTNLVGHLTQTTLPIARGLQSAIHDLVKYKGTRARILIPSRLAFGISGYGFGSSSNINTRIAGNQCLDYYINLVSSVNEYDDYLIRKYMGNNNIQVASYTHIIDPTKRGYGLYYKVITPGTGGDILDETSSFTANYNGRYLNDFVFGGTATDQLTAGTTNLTSFNLSSLVPGVQEALKGQTTGAVVSMFLPSRLGYGKSGNQGIGANVPLHFDFTIGTVDTP
jgi:FKBP-type peptidyl-prolyl cis-trans isomerase FkpA